MVKALALAAMLALSGCATAPLHLDGFIAYWCEVNAPQRPTRAEYALYDEERRREMNAHNSYGVEHCGWKP